MQQWLRTGQLVTFAQGVQPTTAQQTATQHQMDQQTNQQDDDQGFFQGLQFCQMAEPTVDNECPLQHLKKDHRIVYDSDDGDEFFATNCHD